MFNCFAYELNNLFHVRYCAVYDEKSPKVFELLPFTLFSLFHMTSDKNKCKVSLEMNNATTRWDKNIHLRIIRLQ